MQTSKLDSPSLLELDRLWLDEYEELDEEDEEDEEEDEDDEDEEDLVRLRFRFVFSRPDK